MLLGGGVYNDTMPAESTQPHGVAALRLARPLSSLAPVLRWGWVLLTVPGMWLVVLIVLGSALPAVFIIGLLLLLQLPFFFLIQRLLLRWDVPGQEDDCRELFDRYRQPTRAWRQTDL